MAAGITQFQHPVLNKFSLHGGKPRLHVRPSRVTRNVSHIRVDRVEFSRAGETSGEAILRGQERGGNRTARGNSLVDGSDIDLRPVDAELIGAAQPVEMHVADAISTAKYGFRVKAVRHTDPRRPVLVIRIYQRAVIKAPVF